MGHLKKTMATKPTATDKATAANATASDYI
jgi:hypothetical protein